LATLTALDSDLLNSFLWMALVSLMSSAGLSLAHCLLSFLFVSSSTSGLIRSLRYGVLGSSKRFVTLLPLHLLDKPHPGLEEVEAGAQDVAEPVQELELFLRVVVEEADVPPDRRVVLLLHAAAVVLAVRAGAYCEGDPLFFCTFERLNEEIRRRTRVVRIFPDK